VLFWQIRIQVCATDRIHVYTICMCITKLFAEDHANGHQQWYSAYQYNLKTKTQKNFIAKITLSSYKNISWQITILLEFKNSQYKQFSNAHTYCIYMVICHSTVCKDVFYQLDIYALLSING
jgi:hypothetical protein